MNRRLLIAAAAVLAACSDEPISEPTQRALEPHRPSTIGNLTSATILYDQRSSMATMIHVAGFRVIHQADDFSVTATIKVEQIAMSGSLGKPTLPFDIRSDNSGKPGAVIATFDLAPAKVDPNPASNGEPEINDYLFALPSPVTLRAGKYWLTPASTGEPDTVANSVTGVFAWQAHSPIIGSNGIYSGGENESTWEQADADRDFAFVLFGEILDKPQTITFPSLDSAAVGSTTSVGASASSGLAVSYTSLTPTVCTLSGATASNIGEGLCTIAADQAGNEAWHAASRVTRSYNVFRTPQIITYTSVRPSSPMVGDTYIVTATGGASGNPVTFSVSTGNTGCTISANVVTFVAAGSCIVQANQAGNTVYLPATTAFQGMRVRPLGQTITFMSTPPSGLYIGSTYNVTATGGASGNPVVITASPSSECTLSGSTVTFVGFGVCTIAANQAGNRIYDAAPEVTQTASAIYRFEGFGDPVNNDGQLNTAKAGQAIPLKWRLTNAGGIPITTLTSVTVTLKELSCGAGSTEDQIEEYAAGGSGLQNLGNGYYQFNWKSPTSYSGSCKTLTLMLGNEGVTHTALFKFTK